VNSRYHLSGARRRCFLHGNNVRVGGNHMKTTSWRPTAAGVIMMITGFYMVLLLSIILLWSMVAQDTEWKQIVFFFLACISGLIGVFSFVSGIFALKRTRWQLPITGCACVILSMLILVALDKLVLDHSSRDFSVVIACLIPVVSSIPAILFLLVSRRKFVQ
jgi:hypothetical protein